MKNLKMFCLSLEPSHYEFIKELGYIPVGLGEPIYEKIDSDLAKAMMSINAVKGVEIGNGFNSVLETGINNIDEMTLANGKPKFLSNNNGGVLGGISTGQDIVVRFCVKPTKNYYFNKRTS